MAEGIPPDRPLHFHHFLLDHHLPGVSRHWGAWHTGSATRPRLQLLFEAGDLILKLPDPRSSAALAHFWVSVGSGF